MILFVNYCKYSLTKLLQGFLFNSLRLALSAFSGTMGGIHVIEEFPDIFRPAPCIYQTQTVWEKGMNMMLVEKVSVMYGTLLGIVRYQVCHVLYDIWNTSVRSIKLQ